ncbi:MAG: LPD16 domain-containing protein [Sphaerochaetaceae bacterium]|jgi:hypothetical protein|nr:LPD16 domain-containing protein [Sphaerochaetaceae bacterium]NLY07167.1 hypothetical protein [Spirochaetales bacterium]
MEIRQTAFIINTSVYLYILDFEDTYDYTFYNDHYLVMETGKIDRRNNSFQEALQTICSKHYLKPEDIYQLSKEELHEMVQKVDDYEQVNIL